MDPALSHDDKAEYINMFMLLFCFTIRVQASYSESIFCEGKTTQYLYYMKYFRV